MKNNDNYYWPALSYLPLGFVKLKCTLDILGTPKKLWMAPLSVFKEIEGITDNTIDKIDKIRKEINPELEFEKLEKENIKFITFFDLDYPLLLRQICYPPMILYYKGNPPDFNRKTIAIVGTRQSNSYGEKVTLTLSKELAEAGFVVVSGLARGIDYSAHLAVTESGRATWAILGCGLDIIYPRENKKLFLKIQETGTIFSEYPLGTRPLAMNFPARNRIITGLSLGVVVVQCKIKSGAMISANFAIEQNREVFAVPGNIDNPQSAGPNCLINQGAKLVNGVNDILDEFNMRFQSTKSNSLMETVSLETPEEKKVFDILSIDPIGFDDLLYKTNFSSGKLAEVLLLLEFKKLIKQLPGKLFVRTVF